MNHAFTNPLVRLVLKRKIKIDRRNPHEVILNKQHTSSYVGLLVANMDMVIMMGMVDMISIRPMMTVWGILTMMTMLLMMTKITTM
jgi:hypothetical protein